MNDLPSTEVLSDLISENEKLRELLRMTREVLVFADGNSVLLTGRPLAWLYAEDCEWAQGVLRQAGCHSRDARFAEDDDAH